MDANDAAAISERLLRTRNAPVSGSGVLRWSGDVFAVHDARYAVSASNPVGGTLKPAASLLLARPDVVSCEKPV